MDELAQRAVACKHWRWMSRMVDTTGRTFISYADCGEAAWLWVAEDGCEWLPVEGRLPDLTDPATLGCLLALVREAWGCDGLTCQPLLTEGGVHGWLVYMDANRRTREIAATEAEALVAALEAAP